MASPLNLTVVPTVIYEYLFYPQSSERLWPPIHWKVQGLLLESCTSGHWLCPKNLDTTSSLQCQMAGE
jgi:hypothetical protein